MSWRLAQSLAILRNEINQHAPKRSKASDGTIGDTAHSSRVSDHNPNEAGVVCALDLTHDPANGADMHKVTTLALKYRHPALRYVVWNRKIASAKTNWRWIRYDGANAHTKHAHFSVGGPYDDTSSWYMIRLTTGAPAAATSTTKAAMPNSATTRIPPGDRTLETGDRGTDVAFLQRFLGLTADGIFGPKTENKVKTYQRMRGLKIDGVVGQKTWAEIRQGTPLT